MSDGEDTHIAPAEEVEAPPTDKPGNMTIEEALKGVLKNALIHEGLARGIRDAAKTLDRRQAHLCILNESCEEEAYKKLIEALCSEHEIQLIKISDGKKLGEWAGLCKLLLFFFNCGSILRFTLYHRPARP